MLGRYAMSSGGPRSTFGGRMLKLPTAETDLPLERWAWA